MRKKAVWWETRKERDYKEYLDVDGRIVLKFVWVVWTGLIWSRIGTSGGLLCTRQ
jgi:hypothetical protein